MRFRRRRADLDARVAAAEEEKQESGRRLRRMRNEVVEPLEAKERHNQFADIIRRSLQEGHG